MERQESLGDRVRRYREQADLTQAELAEAIGLSRTSLNKIETGVTPRPHTNTLHKLADALKVKVDELLNGKQKEPFFPGGILNKFGASVYQPGELQAMLGPNFGREDVDEAQAAAVPTDSKSFIKMLLQEIDQLKQDNKQLKQSNAHLIAVIEEQRASLKEQRENTTYLRQELAQAKKAAGNQVEAPGTYALVTEPRQEVEGFIRYDRRRKVTPIIALIPEEDEVLVEEPLMKIAA